MINENRANDPKQVIVMRKDLKMRRGKEMAQAAHASGKTIFEQMRFVYKGGKLIVEGEWAIDDPTAIWLTNERFAKVVLYVNSEAELIDLFEQAKASGLPATMITDLGLTEFKGVHTKTCIAIGPADRSAIDKITGHLSTA